MVDTQNCIILFHFPLTWRWNNSSWFCLQIPWRRCANWLIKRFSRYFCILLAVARTWTWAGSWCWRRSRWFQIDIRLSTTFIRLFGFRWFWFYLHGNRWLFTRNFLWRWLFSFFFLLDCRLGVQLFLFITVITFVWSRFKRHEIRARFTSFTYDFDELLKFGITYTIRARDFHGEILTARRHDIDFSIESKKPWSELRCVSATAQHFL